uniref:Uncharacterized protein n=1 Tax=Timema bartmani TaxID=61472 RepID=A0A7R9ESU7_9NEOP|nr:unnamed protein product [Timema bartmani]
MPVIAEADTPEAVLSTLLISVCIVCCRDRGSGGVQVAQSCRLPAICSDVRGPAASQKNSGKSRRSNPGPLNL